jgi:thioredoxin reductase (NADPH)
VRRPHRRDLRVPRRAEPAAHRRHALGRPAHAHDRRGKLPRFSRKQAEKFGTEILEEDATAVDFSRRPFKVTAKGKDFFAKAVIISTGANARNLGLPNEQKLTGRGISYCATCDAPFFKNKNVLVVGGGDTAMEEALFTSKFANRVIVVHRRDSLRASKIMQDRAMTNPKISFVWNTVIKEVKGDKRLEAAVLENVNTGEATTMPIDGIFVAIGYEPATKVFEGHIELDEKGYVKKFGPHGTMTSVEGVFVAGDCEDYRYRQAVTAAGDGCRAAIDAERWLEENK